MKISKEKREKTRREHLRLIRKTNSEIRKTYAANSKWKDERRLVKIWKIVHDIWLGNKQLFGRHLHWCRNNWNNNFISYSSLRCSDFFSYSFLLFARHSTINLYLETFDDRFTIKLSLQPNDRKIFKIVKTLNFLKIRKSRKHKVERSGIYLID